MRASTLSRRGTRPRWRNRDRPAISCLRAPSRLRRRPRNRRGSGLATASKWTSRTLSPGKRFRRRRRPGVHRLRRVDTWRVDQNPLGNDAEQGAPCSTTVSDPWPTRLEQMTPITGGRELTGNTILVTGGGSGIGRALAEQFAARGNRVVIAGRRRDALDAVVYSYHGIESAVLDIDSAAAIGPFVKELILRRPTLNVVIHSAGIMRYERVTKADFSTDVSEATITTNLLGTIRLTTALLPHFLSRPEATIVTISSGLAFVPLAMTPTYCATKAAIHSYSQSLRYQLKDTNVRVVEIAPPYVQSELMGVRQGSDPMAMPLKDYIAETMAILETNPDVTEVLVERVKPQRIAEARGEYNAFFNAYNDRAMAARANEW